MSVEVKNDGLFLVDIALTSLIKMSTVLLITAQSGNFMQSSQAVNWVGTELRVRQGYGKSKPVQSLSIT